MAEIVRAFIGTKPTIGGAIRVFASTKRQLTIRIRQSVGSSGQSGLNRGVIVGEALAHLVSLRQE